MSPRERAEYAQKLLEDPLFRLVLADIRDGLVRAVEESPVGDRDVHHEAVLTLQLLRRIPETLRRYADELLVDKAKEKHEAWIAKARKTLKDFAF